MESYPSNVTFDNVTIFNETLTNQPSDSRCYNLYEYSRTVYIPICHAIIMVAGLIANLYMIITLHCGCSKGPARRTALSDIDVYFTHLGLCDIATLVTIPVWVTETVLVRGWVFGYVVCKLVKGLITFCFQYGIFLMVYINIERYMKVVHNRTMFNDRRKSFRRRMAARLCAGLPVVSSLSDICYYTVRPISAHGMMCFNSMSLQLRLFTFWFRATFCFILPVVIIVYCNGMIVYSVRKHMKKNSFGKGPQMKKRVQVLTSLTVTLFICCWLPWLVSTAYYRSHIECEQVKYIVLNVCIAIGNMHCITSPILYICMKMNRRSAGDSFSLPKIRRPAVSKDGRPSTPLKSKYLRAVMTKCSTSATSE